MAYLGSGKWGSYITASFFANKVERCSRDFWFSAQPWEYCFNRHTFAVWPQINSKRKYFEQKCVWKVLNLFVGNGNRLFLHTPDSIKGAMIDRRVRGLSPFLFNICGNCYSCIWLPKGVLKDGSWTFCINFIFWGNKIMLSQTPTQEAILK